MNRFNVGGIARKVVSGAMVMGVSGLALADTTFDTSSVITVITSVAAAILVLGAAVVAGPKISVKAWKWLGRAL